MDRMEREDLLYDEMHSHRWDLDPAMLRDLAERLVRDGWVPGHEADERVTSARDALLRGSPDGCCPHASLHAQQGRLQSLGEVQKEIMGRTLPKAIWERPSIKRWFVEGVEFAVDSIKEKVRREVEGDR